MTRIDLSPYPFWAEGYPEATGGDSALKDAAMIVLGDCSLGVGKKPPERGSGSLFGLM